MILASNSVKAFRVAVVPSEFTSNVAEFGNPMFRLESLNPKESGDAEEKLPEGYTRVGWIAGAGDALLNTGYYPNHNSEILIDRSGLMDYTMRSFGYGSMRPAQSSSSGAEGYIVMGQKLSGYMLEICLFGAVSSQQDQNAVMFLAPHEDVEWDPSGENPFEGYESEIAETRYSIYMSKDELRVGADSRPNPLTPASVDPWPLPFTLFGASMAYGGDVMDEPIPDMIFSFKVSENGVPVVNMLPCIEDATGQPGFYDTVRGVFITGEGMFFTGEAEDVEPEPLPANLYLFDDCTHYSQVGEIYPSYLRKISDWNYYLNNLQIGGDDNGSMFAKTNGSANTTLRSFSVDLPALTEGEYMFAGCTGLTSFTGDMPNLTNGYKMFYRCDGLTSFEGDMPALTDGSYMFQSLKGLTSFTGDLTALTDGTCMFNACTKLTSWDIELPNLTSGYAMFSVCTGLTSWDIELPKLTGGERMFRSCTGLTSFTGNLSSLTNGSSMFEDCTGLTSFKGNLPALTDGTNMFSGCKLDAPSVLNIAESINDEVVDAPLVIGIDCSSDMSELDSFAQDIYYEDWSDLCRTFYDKGWTVTWGDTDGNSTIYTKYIDCANVSEVTAVNSSYKTDLKNNKWAYLLDNLTSGYQMFRNCDSLTSFNVDLPALTNGEDMFRGTGLTSWDIELPNLTNGYGMFNGCKGLTSFTSDLSALTGGGSMFYECEGLTSWDIELPNLTTGRGMFSHTGLTSWDIELPNLTNGRSMFLSCTSLTSFKGDLPKLTNGMSMFSSCDSLTSFKGDLSALLDGNNMFANCPELTSFEGNLSALTDGFRMFGFDNSSCAKLDLASVQRIANTLKGVTATGTTGNLYLGMDASLQDTEDLETALAAIRAKGWTVIEMYRS